MKRTPPRVLVIGLGNPDRGDDGIGPLVANQLTGFLPPDVEVLAVNGNVLGLIERWTGFEAVICIDAAAPLTAPGRIHRVDLTTGELPKDLTSTSCHGLGLAEAIGLACALQQAPPHIVVYAIEGGSFAPGAPITVEVAAAASEVVGRVATEVERLRRVRGKAVINT
jgi:hydrogenase maturation protease